MSDGITSKRAVPSSPPPAKLLYYNLIYRVLICTSCCYAIQPTAISRHLKDIHQIYRSRRRPYMQYVAKFSLADAEQVIKAHISEFPVKGLPVLDGLRCLGPNACDFLCVSVKRMQSHWLAAHGKHGYENHHDWQTAPLQTFFRGNLVSYFSQPTSTVVVLAPDRRGGSPLPNTTAINSNDPINAPVPDHHVVLRFSTPQANLTTALGPLDEIDERLFYHYLTSTYLTLVDRHGTETIWQETLPQIASENSFLLSIILSCSALHLAYKFPSHRHTYQTRAHMHQNSAMPLFRENIANPNERNVNAILAYAHLLIIYSLAADRPDESMLLGDHSSTEPYKMCSWLYFIRNSCYMVDGLWHLLENGPLAPLACSWDVRIDGADEAFSEQTITTHLLSLVPEVESSVNQEEIEQDDDFTDVTGFEMDNEREIEIWSGRTRQIYKEAATKLGWAFAVSSLLEHDRFTTWDAIRVWPMDVSNEFVQLLIDGHPAALVLLAHYCLLLERLRDSWYFDGRTGRLFDTIMNRLDKKWHSFIQESCYKRDSLLWVSDSNL